MPVPDQILATVQDYLRRRGLPEEPSHPASRDIYLIGRADGQIGPPSDKKGEGDPRVGIGASTLYGQLKAFLAATADDLASNSPNDAHRLRLASLHWLRHTHGSHAVAAWVPVEVVKESLGHASIATTSIYVTTERRRRYAEISKLLD